ncbi:MAG TPA: DUF445 family protein, partial [Chondromyces sp.]|nr:DUF445 family protein [Chondromyces sp.]
MNLVGMLFFMALIGALIGGFTNFLAIKMLFRPYRPLYLGKWKLPFTPGLIPKRHGELATQIGRIVEEYLLTPESIEKKFNELDFQNHITALLQQEAKPLIH